MKRRKNVLCWGPIGLLLALLSPLATAGEPANGWRGNGTGLWPDCSAPLVWNRLAHGALEGMRAQAARPGKEEGAGKAPLAPKGLVAQWLVTPPLPIRDSVENFDEDLLGGEGAASPDVGEKVGPGVWRRIDAPQDDPLQFGNPAMPWVKLAKSEEVRPNHVVYAHCYLHSPRGGAARAVVEHCFGLKAWVNGREVYRATGRMAVVGAYEPLSRLELANVEPPDGQMQFELQPGWNRLLLKISSSPKDDWKQLDFCLRLMDPPNVEYETKNIRWLTELPGRSTSTPIIVGDRIFLAAEPDLLVCLDKESGKLLWSAANNYYEAVPAQERKANPAYAKEVDPLVAELKTADRKRRMVLRRQIEQALLAIDPVRFKVDRDGHFEAHFGIVGYSMPTPVSDGKHVFVWSGLGVAACYDLEGQRQWISVVPTGPLEYGSSPALADGVLAVFLGKLYGLDAKTGELLWTQPKVHKNIAAVLAANLAGKQVIVTQLGEIIRPADGKLLFRPPGAATGDGGCWAPPVILGQTMYVGRYGVKQMSVFDYSQVVDPDWKPALVANIELDLPRSHSLRPDGSWLDRSTAGSTLVHDGLAYKTDIYGWLYVVDVTSGKTVYYQDLELAGLMHYNAVPVAASPTLIGKNIVIVDNQGTALVLAAGREFKILARNRIETQLERVWPIPSQETLAYAPPIADRNRIYLRGERYLYCIGEP